MPFPSLWEDMKLKLWCAFATWCHVVTRVSTVIKCKEKSLAGTRYGNGREGKCNYSVIKWFHRCNYEPFNVRLSLRLYVSAYRMCKQEKWFKHQFTSGYKHTNICARSHTTSHQQSHIHTATFCKSQL